MTRNARWIPLLVALTSIVLLPACRDDNNDSSTDPGGSNDPILGTWAATSFSVNGVDQVLTGMSVSLTFTETTYSIGIMGDSNNVICETTTDCTDGGGFSYTSTTATFDPGTSDEVTLDYTVNGSTLTLSGDIGGVNLLATLTKV